MNKTSLLLIAVTLPLCGVVTAVAVADRGGSRPSPRVPVSTTAAPVPSMSASPGPTTALPTVAASPPCLTSNDVVTLLPKLDAYGPSDPRLGADGAGPNTYAANGGVKRFTVGRERCFHGWLVADVVGYPNDPSGVPANDLVILHWSGGRWELYINGGTDHSEDYGCQSPVPAAARRYLGCS